MITFQTFERLVLDVSDVQNCCQEDDFASRITLPALALHRLKILISLKSLSAPFCSVISFHLFPIFCNTIGQAHEANLQVPCSVKSPHYRVRKCVHKGKPRATNRSRVNPITVQCKVGNKPLSRSLHYLLNCLPVKPQASRQKSLDSQKNSLDLKKNH